MQKVICFDEVDLKIEDGFFSHLANLGLMYPTFKYLVKSFGPIRRPETHIPSQV